MWNARLKVDHGTLIGYEHQISSYEKDLDFFLGISGGMLVNRAPADTIYVGERLLHGKMECVVFKI